jgi:hypothetical protein
MLLSKLNNNRNEFRAAICNNFTPKQIVLQSVQYVNLILSAHFILFFYFVCSSYNLEWAYLN